MPAFFTMLNVKTKIIPESHAVIKTGFILPNHRSWFDFAYESFITDSTYISRKEVSYINGFSGLIMWLENYIIYINRSDSRHKIFELVKYHLENFHPRICFFPEGTRKNHLNLTLEETYTILKPGLLKSVYSYGKEPVQILMSCNKEKVINEKKLVINFGIQVETYISRPIHPKDYKTFEEFYSEICKEWFFSWCKIHCA